MVRGDLALLPDAHQILVVDGADHMLRLAFIHRQAGILVLQEQAKDLVQGRGGGHRDDLDARDDLGRGEAFGLGAARAQQERHQDRPCPAATLAASYNRYDDEDEDDEDLEGVDIPLQSEPENF